MTSLNLEKTVENNTNHRASLTTALDALPLAVLP